VIFAFYRDALAMKQNLLLETSCERLHRFVGVQMHTLIGA
jgi:hypothetical protein